MKKHTVFTLLATLLVALGITEGAKSQVATHPTDPYAVACDTIISTVDLPGSITGKATWSTTVWTMTDSSTELMMHAESIVYNGECNGAEAIKYSDLVETMSEESIKNAIASGHCPDIQGDGQQSVLINAWVARYGAGANTIHIPCDINLFARIAYDVIVISSTSITIAEQSSTIEICEACSASCEPACELPVVLE